MHLDLSQKANSINLDVYSILKKDRLIREAIKEKMQQDFLFFTQVLHHSIHKQKFKVKDFHKTIATALQRVATGDCNRLIINIPPRFGKTLLAVKYFIAWILANNMQARFIHTSYSQSLALENSSGVKEIINSDIYSLLWGYEYKDDAKAKEKWYIKEGGGMYATSHGGQITGFGAGDMEASPFSGCFPYNELVKTEKGYLKIGDIVSKKMNIKVYSFNEKTKKTELKEIENWFENPSNKILEIGLSNKKSFRCTPEHKIYTLQDRWVEAKNLKNYHKLPMHFSNPLYLINRKISYLANFFPAITSIKNNVYNFLRVLKSIIPFSRGQVFCNFSPSFSSFNLSNNSLANFIFFRKSIGAINTSKNLYNLLPFKLCPRSFFQKRESSVFNSILHILTFSSPFKIIKFIVDWISIKVASFSFRKRLRRTKTLQNYVMNTFRSCNTITRKTYSKITTAIKLLFKRFSFKKSFFSIFLNNKSIKAFYISKIRNLIKSFIPFYINPVFVNHIYNAPITYCLQVRSNHNFYVSKSQVLVSNCLILDDPLKSDDANSIIARNEVNTRFDEVLVNRLNNEKVPIVIIMQRLHEDDLTGYLLSKPNHKWEHIKIPVFNEEGNSIWEERFSTKYLQELQKDNAMSFAGQYLQEPAPMEGNIFKDYWIKWNDEKNFDVIYQSWDTAIKKEAQNDYSVCTTWGFKNNEFYLLDCFREKLEFPELLKSIKLHYEKWRPLQIIIEDKASGSQLLQVLRRETQLPIVAYDVSGKGDKVARFNRITTKFESGRVNFSQQHFTNQVLTELKFFPNSKNDDIVDSISNFFNWFEGRITNFATSINVDYVLE